MPVPSLGASLETKGQENIDVPAQLGRVNSIFLHIFVFLRSSTDWIIPTNLGEVHLLSSVYQFKCLSLPETLTDTYRNDLPDNLGILWLTQRNFMFTHKINHHGFCCHIIVCYCSLGFCLRPFSLFSFCPLSLNISIYLMVSNTI